MSRSDRRHRDRCLLRGGYRIIAGLLLWFGAGVCLGADAVYADAGTEVVVREREVP